MIVLALLVGLAVGFLSRGCGRPGQHEGRTVLADSSASFTITGHVNGLLAPGVLVPLDLALDNPHPFALSITELTVTVSGVAAPNAAPGRPCTAGDFRVQQISSTSPFVVSADGSRSLSSLGFAAAQWPAVGLLDRAVNQDGCKGASVTLAYTAIGSSVAT